MQVLDGSKKKTGSLHIKIYNECKPHTRSTVAKMHHLTIKSNINHLLWIILWVTIGNLIGIVQLWNDHIPHEKKKLKSVSILYLWTGSLHKYSIDSDHLFLSSKRLWNAYIQFRGCDWWREAAQVSSPQPKRGHRWSINQCPPWGTMQINKKGFFPSSGAEGTVLEDCLRTP